MSFLAEFEGQPLIPLRCTAVRPETCSAKTYDFAVPDAAGLAVEPGQFVNLVFQIDGAPHLRSYTVSSSWQPGRLSITVKKVAGGCVSNWLFDDLKPGDTVGALNAAGSFTCPAPAKEPLLFLTAGSGITPAAAILRSMVDQGDETDVVLIHFADRPAEMIFLPEMAHWARQLPKARIIPVITRPAPYSGWLGPVGRLSPALLQGLVPDLAERRLYCCGPAGFMELAARMAKAAGLPETRIVTESFDSHSAVEPASETSEEAAALYSVAFQKSGKSIQIAPDTTVLKAAKSSDVRIVTSCNKGLCGTCRVKLLSGTVQINHQGGIKQREIDQGFILACCSTATSDIVIDR